MSISSSLSNALSGLTAAARMADVVASNTANAMTEGYARRELELASQSMGGTGAGVRVVGVNRVTNEVVLQDRRLSDAAVSNAEIRSDFLSRLEGRIGNSDDPQSLSARFAAFESALIEASSRPDSASRLASVLESARSIVTQVNSLDRELSTIRGEADQSIGAQVKRLNESLAQVDELNAVILAQRSSGRDATALMDQRQALVDEIAQIVPVRQVNRDHDQISLFTTGGAILLEGNAAVIGFDTVGVITADMTQASGALSGLTLNGMPISSADDGVLGGGALGALFAIRDELAPSAQGQIDAVARDLIERFSDSSIDPTIPPGAPGLFADNGGALDPLLEVGLAGRLQLNASVDPLQGGEAWRLRDGLGAVTEGVSGNADILNGMISALSQDRLPSSGEFSGGPFSASSLVGHLASQVAGDRLSAETREAYALSRQESLTQLSLADGVDTDHEMQMLLKVEQAYAANARVIQTIDALISQMLEL
jgi:flagellar hook-associated protein 1 FlgK